MSKTSQKQEKEDGSHGMAQRLCRLGASQHQWIPAAGNQGQGAPASWARCVLGFPGMVASQKCRPALPWLKGCTSCALSSCVRSSSSVTQQPGIGRDLLAKKTARIRKTHITSCWLRTTPRACPKTGQWGKIWNQSQNCSETILQTKQKKAFLSN